MLSARCLVGTFFLLSQNIFLVWRRYVGGHVRMMVQAGKQVRQVVTC